MDRKRSREDSSVKFSYEDLIDLQKESLWAELQLYKRKSESFEEELKYCRNEKTMFNNLFFTILNIINSNAPDESAMNEILSFFAKLDDGDATSYHSFFHQLVDVFFSQRKDRDELFNLALLQGKVLALEFDKKELVTELDSLKQKLVKSQRNDFKRSLRSLPEVQEVKIIHNVEQEKQRDESTAPNDKLAILETELLALRELDIKRTAELKELSENYSRTLAFVKQLEARLHAIPAEIQADPLVWTSLSQHRDHLLRELEYRDKALADLERHIGESNSKRSEMLSSLESELSQGRSKLKDFIDSLEFDCARFRKERDHMRELYETVNLQATSQLKQLALMQKELGLSQTRTNVIDSELKKLQDFVNGHLSEESLALISELGSIADAFDILQQENLKLLQMISDKDDIISRLTGEKLKLEFSCVQAQREADLIRQKAAKIESESINRNDEIETKMKSLRQRYDYVEKVLSEKMSQCEHLQWSLNDKVSELRRLKSLLENKSLTDVLKSVSSLTEQLDSEAFSKKRLQEALDIANQKLNHFISGNNQVPKDRESELDIYKKLMKCNSCHLRDKNTVLSKCMHVFCRTCIETRIETRQRKCPNCGESFGVNDVKTIYL